MRKLAVMKADKELQSLLDAFGKMEGAIIEAAVV
jgi:transcription-repair coupling factor (superfamily II helicase)